MLQLVQDINQPINTPNLIRDPYRHHPRHDQHHANCDIIVRYCFCDHLMITLLIACWIVTNADHSRTRSHTNPNDYSATCLLDNYHSHIILIVLSLIIFSRPACTCECRSFLLPSWP